MVRLLHIARHRAAAPIGRVRRMALITIVATMGTTGEPLHAADQGEMVSIGHIRQVRSALLSEERPLQVHLPPSYEEGDRAYPALICLDGEHLFVSGVVAAEQLSGMEEAPVVPEMIVVGIPNLPSTRERDMLPERCPYAPEGAGPGRFLRFLKEEVIPFIHANYRATDERILVGGSNSGFFAWWAMLQGPRLFTAVVAISPSFADCREYMLDEVRSSARTQAWDDAYLYVARGGQGREQGVSESLAMLLPLLEPCEKLTIRTAVYETLGHVPSPALYDALEALGSEGRIGRRDRDSPETSSRQDQ